MQSAHVSGLDGLRAIAIAAVLAFHLRLPWSMLGWMGVQLFFVISGFLITRILISARSESQPFRTFYIRRTLRIFPIYYLYIAIVVGLMALAGSSEWLHQIPFYLTYLQNMSMPISGTALFATEHTWSLAVEEQFYLFWPLIVIVMSRRSIRVAIGLMVVVAPLSRLLLVQIDETLLAAGMLTSNVDVLAVGAAIAVAQWERFPTEKLRRLGTLSILAGSISLVWMTSSIGLESFWAPTDWLEAPLGFLYQTAIAALFGGVVTLVATGTSPRFLEYRPIAYLGRISYGIYVYHLLVFWIVGALAVAIFDDPLEGGVVYLVAAVSVLAAVAAAAVSWRLLEQPILKWKDKLAPKVTAGFSQDFAQGTDSQ